MDTDSTDRRKPRYLIAVKNCLVAEDIAGTIAELYPEASILSARTLKDAEDIVRRAGGVGIAIVEIGELDPDAASAGSILSGCGTRVIYLSDPPETSEETAKVPATFLQKPFTTDGLVQALRSAEAGPTCGPARDAH